MKKSAIVAGMICFVISVSVAAPGVQGTAGQQEREKALASLVEAERGFSRTSDEKGIPAAFLAWLAPDAVVFRPMPVEGRPVYEKMDPANPAHLIWEPEVAEIAASGEMGYTSGPYRLSPQRGAEPTRFGHYVSVWKKQPDGAWRVFLDIGVQHDRPETPAIPGKVDAPAANKNAEALSPERLRDEDRAFGPRAGSIIAEAAAKGMRKALSEFATDDVRIYRPGKLPSVGRSRIKEQVPASVGRASGGPQSQGRIHTGLAWSGDLAYSYGTFDLWTTKTTAETTSFLHIWRKDASGRWKICLDIQIPVPAEKEKTG